MNIKETALKVWDSNMIECPPENLTKFAEALVAELANENKPFAWYDGNKFYANEESASMACADMANLKPVFTSPPNIADIEHETAEAIAKLLENGNFLSKESLIALAANGVAKAIRSGAWKEMK